MFRNLHFSHLTSGLCSKIQTCNPFFLALLRIRCFQKFFLKISVPSTSRDMDHKILRVKKTPQWRWGKEGRKAKSLCRTTDSPSLRTCSLDLWLLGKAAWKAACSAITGFSRHPIRNVSVDGQVRPLKRFTNDINILKTTFHRICVTLTDWAPTYNWLGG